MALYRYVDDAIIIYIQPYTAVRNRFKIVISVRKIYQNKFLLAVTNELFTYRQFI